LLQYYEYSNVMLHLYWQCNVYNPVLKTAHNRQDITKHLQSCDVKHDVTHRDNAPLWCHILPSHLVRWRPWGFPRIL